MLRDYDEILPGRLWVGSYVEPEEIGLLKQIGITSIVSLQSDRDLMAYSISADDMQQACAALGIEFRRAPVLDFDPEALSQNLDNCVREVEKAAARPSARIYLHCTAGKNRAPTVAAAFLMRTRDLSALQAFEYLIGRRDCQPYLSVLEKYEETFGRGIDKGDPEPSSTEA